MNYEERRSMLIEREKERKINETNEFLSSIDKLYDATDSIIHPFVSIKRKLKDNYIQYSITKYPNCLQYSIVKYRNDYPFSIYYEKKYYKDEIPKSHVKEFEELEKLF